LNSGNTVLAKYILKHTTLPLSSKPMGSKAWVRKIVFVGKLQIL